MSEEFNMSMRKFLKQVGVTSQQAIENAMREAGGTTGKSFEAKMVLNYLMCSRTSIMVISGFKINLE